MQSFIRTDQYHYIQEQTRTLVNSRSSTNDQAVTSAIKAMTQEKVIDIFHNLTEDQKQMIAQIDQVKDEGDALFFLSRLKQYILPFPSITEHEIKQLFPKAKKINVPNVEEVSWNQLSYLGWNDPGSLKKYIVTRRNDEWVGLQGSFTPSNQPGICTICHETADVGMFAITKKGKGPEQTITRGNYICHDSDQCNRNLTDAYSLHKFIDRLEA